jgi:hypothetical protein
MICQKSISVYTQAHTSVQNYLIIETQTDTQTQKIIYETQNLLHQNIWLSDELCR